MRCCLQNRGHVLAWLHPRGRVVPWLHPRGHVLPWLHHRGHHHTLMVVSLALRNHAWMHHLLLLMLRYGLHLCSGRLLLLLFVVSRFPLNFQENADSTTKATTADEDDEPDQESNENISVSYFGVFLCWVFAHGLCVTSATATAAHLLCTEVIVIIVSARTRPGTVPLTSVI